jgi:CRISPR/Cas system CSM-associated protein Csm3 (group 7 of RAMP superfamily)
MHRLDLGFAIAWEATWHVGSGFSMAMADRLIQRRGGRLGVPFVPGSQLKGVLRHQVERLAATLGCRVVAPHALDPDQETELVRHFRPLERSRLVVDRLFGTRYQGECLYVDETTRPAAGATPTWHDHRLVARTAMDRVTGTVREKRLFITEVAEGGWRNLVLHSRIRARHGDGVLTVVESFPLEYSLLVAALLSIDALGGNKGIGQGQCQIKILEDRVRYNGQDLTLDAVLAGLVRTDDWKAGLDLFDDERGQP